MHWIQRNHFICVHVLYKSLCVKFKSYGKTLKQISSAIISNLLLVIDIIFKSIPCHINNLLCANKNVSSYVITYKVQELCQTIWKIFAMGTMHVQMLSWFVFISWQVWQDHRSNIPYQITWIFHLSCSSVCPAVYSSLSQISCSFSQ